MQVVIMGAWDRSEAEDHKLVNDLIDQLLGKYPSLTIVSAGCDRGIGKVVKNRLMPKGTHSEECPFYEIAVRVYGKNIPKSKMAALWHARNVMLKEIGEEFHLFMDKNSKSGGQMKELLKMAQDAGSPCATYEHGKDETPRMVKA